MMEMYLLDTNILSELMRPAPEVAVVAWLDHHPTQAQFYSSITKTEILSGIELLPEGKRKHSLKNAVMNVLALFGERCHNYNCTTVEYYIEIEALSRKSGRPMSREDMMIAAIASEHNFTLVTRNVTDFNFLPALNLLNPWED